MKTSKWFASMRSVNLALGIILAGSITVISAVYIISVKMAGQLSGLVSAAMEIKYDVSAAYINLGQVGVVATTDSADQFHNHVQQADLYARAMLEGVQNPECELIPIDDPELRIQVGYLRDKLAIFDQTAGALLKDKTRSARAGSGRDLYALYTSLIAETDHVATVLQNDLGKQLRVYRGLILLTILGIGLLTALAYFVFRQYYTERNQASKNLFQSKERLRLLAENSIYLVYHYRLKPTPGFEYVSTSALNICGYTPEEHYQDPSLGNKIVHPDDQHLLTHLLDGELWDVPITIRWIRKDGQIIWIKQKMVPVRNEAGELVAYEGIARDISQHKQSEDLQSAVYQISDAANKTDSLEDLYSRIHQIIGQLMPAENFFIAIYDASINSFHFPYYVDEYDKAPPEPEKLENGLTGYMFRSGKPLQITKQQLLNLADRGKIDIIGTVCLDWVGAPLISHDKKLGALAVQSYTEGVRFGQLELDMLSYVSEQVAMAIERKMAEEALKESESRYRLLFQSNPNCMWVYDRESLEFLAVNNATVHHYGFSEEEFLSITMSDIRLPEDVTAMEEAVGATPSGIDYAGVWRHRKKNGDLIYMDITSHTLDFAGRNAVVVLSSDVTEQRQALNALQESEHKYRTLFENMLSGFAYHKIIVDENEEPIDYVFLEINQQYTKQTGITRDIIDEQVTEILSIKKGQGPDFINIYGKVALTGESTRFEVYFAPLEKWFLISAYSPVKGYFVTVFDDITDRKSAEKEREQLLSELADKNRDLEQIIYISSHDLRAPLVNIQGFSDILDSSIADVNQTLADSKLPAKIKQRLSTPIQKVIPEALQYILASASKVDSLLTGLLQFSRLGRAQLKIEEVDVTSLLRTIRENFEFQIQEARARVEISQLPACTADESQVNQVFTYLLDNALKYLGPKRKGRIRISGKSEGEQTVYCVADNGIGIEPDHHEKIFEMFSRLDYKVNAGEGLGLTNARKILSRLGGNIKVESQPGKGSKFYVSLPS
ncbi:MAG: PAS domain S-box protein [Candidatus Neomarinimicrobiota bacterium]